MPPSIWVYDIETTPNLVYSWGLWQQNIAINQIVKSQDILCFAAHKVGTKTVEAHAAWDDREAMIRRLWEIMDDADFMVGYNHAGFDNKHVNAAYIKADMKPPSPYQDKDLLKVVRKHFNFPSRKLDYVCGALGLDVKVSTGGMDLWTKCMNGDPAAQRKMLKYNKQDVRITTQLFHHLNALSWVDTGIGQLFFDEDAVARCIACGGDRIQRRGWLPSSNGQWKRQRFQCADDKCGKWMVSGKRVPMMAAV